MTQSDLEVGGPAALPPRHASHSAFPNRDYLNDALIMERRKRDFNNHIVHEAIECGA